ncbi:MAG: ABC transporter substrate-binding protein [Actinobacteria bacterium]|nr:ABC transporter substrate-binding protein [Actinomycetota bacterium]
MQQRLSRLRSRGQTYAFLIGVLCTLLVGALLIPFVFGERATTIAAAPAPAPADTAVTTTVTGPAGGEIPAPSDGTAAPVASTAASVTAARAGSSGPGSSRPGAGAPVAAGPGVAGPQGVARTASDQGVTPESIRLGVVITDLGGTSALGFKPSGYNPDEQKRYFDAHIDELNRQGGVNGRKIQAFYEIVDILDQNSMRTACRTLAQDKKVFAVTHVLGVYGDPILCFTEQQKLPYLAWDGAVLDYYSRSGGLLFTTQPSTRRTSLDMVRRLNELGELNGKKIGILRYAEYLDTDMTALVDYTKALVGELNVVDAEISVSNVGAVPGQLSLAVDRFQQAGVKQVFLMTNTLYAQQFVSQAERRGFLPDYAVSDFDYASAGNGFLTDMPASFYRRGLMVTSTRVGDGQPTDPVDAACNEVASAVEKRKLAPPDKLFYNYMASCGLVRLFAQGVSGAGTNPTRRGFSEALQRLGSFPNPGFAASSLAPGKFAATDQIRLVQAEAGCKCWRPAGDFTPTGFRGS